MKNKFFWIILVLVVGGLIGVFALAGGNDSTPPAAGTNQEVNAQDHVTGNSKAKHTLIEYADFQCPACGQTAPWIERLAKEYKTELRIVYRHFPLSNIHPNAFPAARAAEAAGSQGKFWEMNSLLFSRQDDWSESTRVIEIFRAYAEELKLDMNKFNDTYNAGATTSRINRDISIGNDLGVDSTPTFYLDNKVIPSPGSYEALAEAIAKVVEES